MRNQKSGTQHAVVNAKGQFTVPFFEGNAAFYESSDCIKISNAQYKRWGLVKPHGSPGLPTEYDFIEKCGPGFLLYQGNSFGLVNAQGDLVIPCRFSSIRFHPPAHYSAILQMDSAYVFDTLGRAVQAFQRRAFQIEGLFLKIAKEDRWGLTDFAGKPVTAFEFTNIGSYLLDIVFNPDCNADVPFGFQNEKYLWGFLDKQGQELIPAQFNEIKPFKDGKAKVFKDAQWFWIDETGRRL